MAYCTKCGAFLTNEGTYCTKCGEMKKPLHSVRTAEREGKDRNILFICLIFAIICLALIVILGILSITNASDMLAIIGQSTNEIEAAGGIAAAAALSIACFLYILIAVVIVTLAIVFNKKALDKNSLQKPQRRKNAITLFVFFTILAVLMLIIFVLQLYALGGVAVYQSYFGKSFLPKAEHFMNVYTFNTISAVIMLGMSIAAVIMSLVYMLRSCIRKMSD